MRLVRIHEPAGVQWDRSRDPKEFDEEGVVTGRKFYVTEELPEDK